jgi:serine/threonine protein kinase
MDFERLGPYQIGPRIGKGGMGSVYRATSVTTGELAAIKVLAPQLASTEGFRERFQAEVESLKTLQHDGIVRLIGYGEEQGTLYYVMELVDGRSLEEELKAGRRFNWREVVDIAIQVCRALKHAHDHGIVHRDIKPANILIDKEDRIKLADFGIARLFGGTQLTVAGGVLGTADYMSPEQAEGKPVTDRSDQYGLGGSMYALLAGRPPFKASNLLEMLQLQRFAEPESVKRYAPDVPDQLDLVIRQLLSKSPDARFPNTLVLSRHLEAMRRALSRPQLLDAAPASPNATAEEVPFDMAVTQAEADLSGRTGNRDSDFDLDETNDAPAEEESLDLITLGSDPTMVDRGTQATRPTRDHFVSVPNRAETASQRSSLSLSVLGSALALAALLGLVGWIGWRIMQPHTADQLYALVETDPENPDIERLRGRDQELAEFLDRFPDDPRAGTIRQWQSALELDTRQRYFSTLARGRGPGSQLLLSERLYLEAWQLSDIQPALAAEKLERLIGLYPDLSLDPVATHGNDEEKRLALCVELARQHLARLEPQLEQLYQEDRKELESRLQKAKQLYNDSPQQARAICDSLIAEFASQAWAEPLVSEARQLLSEWQVAADQRAARN